MHFKILLLLSVLFCTGCSHVMSDAARLQVDPAITYQAMAAKPDSMVGKTVMVGGILTGVSSSGDVTTLEISQLELLANGVPDESSASGDRFFAISTELVNPGMYRPGSLVTLIGIVKGKKVQVRNGSDYSYPLLSVKEIRLFRPSRDLPDPYPNPYQRTVGDDRFILSPPGLPGGEPRKLP